MCGSAAVVLVPQLWRLLLYYEQFLTGWAPGQRPDSLPVQLQLARAVDLPDAIGQKATRAPRRPPDLTKPLDKTSTWPCGILTSGWGLLLIRIGSLRVACPDRRIKMARQPNIVSIFSDQQRWDTVGCYGGSFAELDLTPNLDRMASEGVPFEYAFTCQPVCGPASGSRGAAECIA